MEEGVTTSSTGVRSSSKSKILYVRLFSSGRISDPWNSIRFNPVPNSYSIDSISLPFEYLEDSWSIPRGFGGILQGEKGRVMPPHPPGLLKDL